MMRTIRNVTFVGLLATAYLPSTGVHAHDSSCWADHVYTIQPPDPNWGDRYFVGECDNCDTDAWTMAIESCNYDEVMVDYYCSDDPPTLILWWCHVLRWD